MWTGCSTALRRAQVRFDPDTVTSPKTYKAAWMAAGGVMEAIRAVLAGEVRNAFALIRPPGHHALRDRAMGFCIFNNLAIGAKYALNDHGLERVMIVDWDLHHGNGIQDIFYEDPHVLYFSVHRYPYYPWTGGAEEVGEGEGKGFNVNVPLEMRLFRSGLCQIYSPSSVAHCPAVQTGDHPGGCRL